MTPTTPKDKSQEGPYVAYQSLVDSNCWIVRFGTLGPVYDFPSPVMAGNACDALNTAYAKGFAAGQADTGLSVDHVIEVRNAIIELRMTGVNIPTTEAIIEHLATRRLSESPTNP